MPTSAADLRAVLNAPADLEALYRRDEAAFRAAFNEVAAATPDSETVRVWRARLDYRPAARAWGGRDFWTALALALTIALLVRLPALFADPDWFYPHFAPSLVILSVAAYFWAKRGDQRTLIIGAVFALVVFTFTTYLPQGEAPRW